MPRRYTTRHQAASRTYDKDDSGGSENHSDNLVVAERPKKVADIDVLKLHRSVSVLNQVKL